MELIIKPTGYCNFACNFCLSGKMASNIKHFNHVPDELKNIIQILKPNTIIVNGGDPLLSGPNYFYELLDCCTSNIAIVTNLKAFYQNPDVWTELFKNPRVSITTSFQYGSGRRWNDSTVYDEKMFKSVCKLFKQKVGYVPMFISVITSENEKYALEHLKLAKELNTTCKLNPVLPLGISNEAYPKYKMVDIWLKAQQSDLAKYLDGDIQFYSGGCSFNTCLMCESTIRVVWFDVTGKLHYSSCDNCSTLGDSIAIDEITPQPRKMKLDPKLFLNGSKCLQCELCRFCNACKANREANRNDKNYCDEMQKRKQAILKSGWLI